MQRFCFFYLHELLRFKISQVSVDKFENELFNVVIYFTNKGRTLQW